MKKRYIILPALLLLVPTPAYAAPNDEMLTVAPLNFEKDGYFEASLSPGDTIDFKLEVTTTSDAHLKSFIANAVPRVNGGFSVDDLALTRAAEWFSYPGEDFSLNGSREEIFSLKVPEDAPAGEHAAAVVIETDYSDAGDGFSHRFRQTVPVNITVAGNAPPNFSFGDASHDFRSGRSVVAVETINDGGRHVSPEGQMEIREKSGAVVSTADVKMASIYTGTTALAEVSLDSALLPGEYTASPSLTDTKSDAAARAEAIPFMVEGKPEVGDEENLFGVIQEPDAGWLLPIIGGLLVLILIALILLLRRKKK